MGVTKIHNINQLLDAVIECVEESGVENVQITQIAARANISTRTIHRYYPEKETLLCDAASRFLSQFYLCFLGSYQKADYSELSGMDRIMNVLCAIKDYCLSEAVNTRLLIDMRMYRVQQGLKFGFPNVPGSERIQEYVRQCIDIGKEDGSIRCDLHRDHVDKVISCTFNGVLQRILLRHPEEEIAVEQESFMQAVFEEYLAFLRTYLDPDQGAIQR